MIVVVVVLVVVAMVVVVVAMVVFFESPIVISLVDNDGIADFDFDWTSTKSNLSAIGEVSIKDVATKVVAVRISVVGDEDDDKQVAFLCPFPNFPSKSF